MSKSSHRSRSAAKSILALSVTNPRLLLGVAAVVVVAVAALFLLTRNSGQPAPAQTSDEITVAEAVSRRDTGAFMLDVREPSEWVGYRMPDSTLIPLGELASRVAEVPRDRPIVVVCHAGGRSQKGRDILLNAGFTNVVNMAGGLREWRDAGYPTVTGP